MAQETDTGNPPDLAASPNGVSPKARRLEYLPLDDLVPASRNPKRHDLTAVRTSIERFGFASPALRDERTGRLVVGHGRIEALRQIRDGGQSPPAGVQVDDQGRWLVPVVCGWASRSDVEAEAYLVADNRHPDLGGWDYPELTDLLQSVQENDSELLRLIGFDEDELAQLVASQQIPDFADYADPIPPPFGPSTSQAGNATGPAGETGPAGNATGPVEQKVICPNCGEAFNPGPAHNGPQRDEESSLDGDDIV